MPKNEDDLIEDLLNDAVPLSSLRVECAIFLIRDQLDDVVEAHHTGNLLEQINAVAFVTIIARQVTLTSNNHVRVLLQQKKGS